MLVYQRAIAVQPEMTKPQRSPRTPQPLVQNVWRIDVLRPVEAHGLSPITVLSIDHTKMENKIQYLNLYT
jgi:hypothetical protein